MCFALAISCQNNLFFEQVMPINGQKVSSFPEDIEGSYLTLDFSEQEVVGELHRIVRTSNSELTIYQQQVEYVDSTFLATKELRQIDTAWFEQGKVYFRSGKTVQSIYYLDALCFSAEEVEFYFNISTNTYLNESGDSIHFELKTANDAIYLNTKDENSYQQVIQVKIENDQLHFTLPYIIINDSTRLAQFKEKYKFKHFDNDGNDDLLGNLDDQAFQELMQEEDFLFEYAWHKVTTTRENSSWPIFLAGIIISLLAFFLFRRFLRSK